MPVSYLAGTAASIFGTTSVGAYGSFSYDSGSSGADRCLVVTVMHENGIPGPTGITYNSVALTKVDEVVVNPSDNFSETGEIWVLVNPAVGINTLAFSGAGGTQDGSATAAVYTGVDQDAPTGASASTTTLEASAVSDVTTQINKPLSDDFVIWTYVHDRGPLTFTAVSDNVLLASWTADEAAIAGSSAGAGYRAVGSGTVTVGVTRSGATGRDNGILATVLKANTTAPSITDVNTTNNVVPGTTATITGTNLTNTSGITVGGVAQSAVTVVNSTTVTFTVVRGGNPYNQDLTAELTSSDGIASITVQQVPAADEFAVTASNPNTTDDASFWEGLVDTSTGDPVTIVNGDQGLAYDFAALEGENISFSIDPTGNITAEFTGTFKAIIWLASEGVWGGEQTVSYTTTVSSGPAVSTVNVPTAGSYGIGDTLSFTVNWDVSATVTGTPRLPITLATGTVYADYASGTGTTALVFSYTVQEGDNDADGIALGAIELNGGTIKDASTNNASLTLSGVESTAGVLVDGVRPVITIAGANPYNMTVGETYVEQGATASDNQDGSLGSVSPTGSVDGQTEGQYTITYPGAGVVDAAGNVALDVTRVVNVNAVDAWPFSKRISYAAPKTWTWGGRHPKTGMRVRIFK